MSDLEQPKLSRRESVARLLIMGALVGLVYNVFIWVLTWYGLAQAASNLIQNRSVIMGAAAFVFEYWAVLVFALGVFMLACIHHGHPRSWIAKTRAGRLEPQPVFKAIDQLKALLGEGDQLATRFQIPSAPKPSFNEVQDWQARVIACAQQNALVGRVEPPDRKKLSEEWHQDDLLRIEALLQDYGCLENVDNTGRVTFRSIWGGVKRLEELIAVIEKPAENNSSLVMVQTQEKIAAELERLTDLRRSERQKEVLDRQES
jgi:hypothetical protein